MTVKGFLVDEITQATPTCREDGNVERCLEEWQSLLLGHISSAQQQLYTRGGSLSEAFWRTVLGNRWHEQPGSSIQQVTDHIPRLGSFPPRTMEEEIKLRNMIKNELNGANRFALCASRRMFQTKQGLLGLGPSSIQTGDVVAVIYGARVPIILRPLEKGSWRVLGDRSAIVSLIIERDLTSFSYVHGIMQGEIVKEASSEQTFRMQDFDLY
jgi:hypothetical protein